MLDAGVIKQVTDRSVAPVLADEKDQKIRELEIQLKELLESNRKKDLEIERLRAQAQSSKKPELEQVSGEDQLISGEDKKDQGPKRIEPIWWTLTLICMQHSKI